MADEKRKLTDEQIENWRKTLFTMYGAVALVLPVEDIEKFRDMMQERANSLVATEED